MLTREERVDMLSTQMILNGRVFDSEVLFKPGMCNLANIVEMKSWTLLFVGFDPYLYESQVREFYYYFVIEHNGSLTSKVGKRKLISSKEVLAECWKCHVKGPGQLLERLVPKVLRKNVRRCLTWTPLMFQRYFWKEVIIFTLNLSITFYCLDLRRGQWHLSFICFLLNLNKFEPINLSIIILEHMRKILIVKDGKHGLGYGYFLIGVFQHFEFSLDIGQGAQ